MVRLVWQSASDVSSLEAVTCERVSVCVFVGCVDISVSCV